jgi:hypothetical protein
MLSKKYKSIEAATSEAAQLGMITPDMRHFLDVSQPVPNYSHCFEVTADINVAELIKHGFSLTN